MNVVELNLIFQVYCSMLENLNSLIQISVKLMLEHAVDQLLAICSGLESALHSFSFNMQADGSSPEAMGVIMARSDISQTVLSCHAVLMSVKGNIRRQEGGDRYQLMHVTTIIDQLKECLSNARAAFDEYRRFQQVNRGCLPDLRLPRHPSSPRSPSSPQSTVVYDYSIGYRNQNQLNRENEESNEEEDIALGNQEQMNQGNEEESGEEIGGNEEEFGENDEGNEENLEDVE